MIRRVCSYCQTELGWIEAPEADERRESHSVCRDCLDECMAGDGQSIDAFLDSLAVPVFVIDHDGETIAANVLGKETMAENDASACQPLGGELFGCVHAHLPGGCGHALGGQSCTIRRAVKKTSETGQPCTRVPACDDLDTIIGPRRRRYLITTRPAGRTVLLRIEDA